jgi:transducin (beta)-like 1
VSPDLGQNGTESVESSEIERSKGGSEPGQLSQITPDNVVVLDGHESEVFVCVWNPTQSILASGSGDGTARLWYMSEDGSETSWTPAILPHAQKDTGKDITTLDWNVSHLSESTTMASLILTTSTKQSSGTLLATGSYDFNVRVWTSSGKDCNDINQRWFFLF